MRTVKLARNSVNEFVYDEHNERLLVYKTDGGIRSIKCDFSDAQKIRDNYFEKYGVMIQLSSVPMVFQVRPNYLF